MKNTEHKKKKLEIYTKKVNILKLSFGGIKENLISVFYVYIPSYNLQYLINTF